MIAPPTPVAKAAVATDADPTIVTPIVDEEGGDSECEIRIFRRPFRLGVVKQRGRSPWSILEVDIIGLKGGYNGELWSVGLWVDS